MVVEMDLVRVVTRVYALQNEVVSRVESHRKHAQVAGNESLEWLKTSILMRQSLLLLATDNFDVSISVLYRYP